MSHQSAKSFPYLLDVLFGNPAKTRMLKLFFRNPYAAFSAREVAERTQYSPSKIQPYLKEFVRAGIVRSRGQGKRVKFFVERAFPFFAELRKIIAESQALSDEELVRKIKKAGTPKLVVAAGVFLASPQKRTDLLVVGDRISERRLAAIMRGVEADVGEEITWTLFSTKEFRYRMKMFDRFLRDIVEYPHRVLMDKIGMK